MTFRSHRMTALVLSAVVVFAAGLGAGTPAWSADKPTNSKVAAKPLKAAKDSLDAKKYQDAIAKLKDVQALQGKNSYDEHLINEMLGYAYVKTNQYPEAAKVLEADLDSGFVTGGDASKRVRQLLQINYQLKNYDKVLALGDRAIKGGYADDDVYTWMGQAYYLKGDYKGAAKFIDAQVGNQIKSGKKPKESLLVLIQNSCTRTSDGECLQRTLERLVTYYPKTAYWQGLVDAMYRQQSGQTDTILLQVYRLATAVDVLKRPSDYTEFAQLALEAGSPGEAQSVLEKGFEKKIFVEPRDLDKNKRLLESAKKAAVTNQATLTKVDAEAAAAATGDKDVNVGLTYLGYQQYDKAVAAIQRGLAKPGLQNAANARLLLGIAQLGAGRKDEARKAFKAVKGDAT
ncbi:MAG: tetratricopeptide repeat protein, partial [Gammaproteobacteria bacterium]